MARCCVSQLQAACSATVSRTVLVLDKQGLGCALTIGFAWTTCACIPERFSFLILNLWERQVLWHPQPSQCRQVLHHWQGQDWLGLFVAVDTPARLAFSALVVSFKQLMLPLMLLGNAPWLLVASSFCCLS